MTDKRYHFPGGAGTEPRWFPAPDRPVMVFAEADPAPMSRMGRPLAVSPAGETAAVRKKSLKPGQKWTECQLPNGGMLI